MTLHDTAIDSPVPSSLARTFLAAAHVREDTDDDDSDDHPGFLALAFVRPFKTARVILSRDLRDSPHEGRVLREVMEAAAGAARPGLHVWTDRGRP